MSHMKIRTKTTIDMPFWREREKKYCGIYGILLGIRPSSIKEERAYLGYPSASSCQNQGFIEICWESLKINIISGRKGQMVKGRNMF